MEILVMVIAGTGAMIRAAVILAFAAAMALGSGAVADDTAGLEATKQIVEY